MAEFINHKGLKFFFNLCILFFVFDFICSCVKKPANDGIISGIVQQQNGTSVSDVVVTLTSNTVNLSNISGSSGEYRFQKLPRGNYQIHAGFRKETISSTNDTNIIIGEGSISSQINKDKESIVANIVTTLDTIGNASISGIVSHSGTPIPLASVELIILLPPNFQQAYKSTQADSSGRFRFESLRKRNYLLSANFKIIINSSATDHTFTAGTGTTNVQIKAFSQNLTANIETSLDTLSEPIPITGGGSCPYVYAFNGNSYIFNGDIYAGAIYACLERHDYIPLTEMKAVDGEYKIKISDELQERQYTNLAELMVVSHPKNVEILMDKNGNIQTLSDKHGPRSALSPNGIDYMSSIDKVDGVSYLFNEKSNKELTWYENISDIFVPQTGKTSLILTFDKLKNVEKGKFVVKAKNSDWSVALWHEFTGFFGAHYNQWQTEQNLRPASELLQWRLDEGIPIMVSVETENGWEYIDCFNIVGSVISRDMVMPINLSAISGDKMRIKLECAFMFWELDYAAMDFTENAALSIETISPNSISTENGRKKCEELKADDNLYLSHLKCGEANVLTYPVSKLSVDANCSFFLHSKGYYEQIVNSKEDRQIMKLLGFMRPGAFAQYSLERYFELSAASELAMH